MVETRGWICPVCNCWLDADIDECDGIYDDDCGVDTRHDPVRRPRHLTLVSGSALSERHNSNQTGEQHGEH